MKLWSSYGVKSSEKLQSWFARYVRNVGRFSRLRLVLSTSWFKIYPRPTFVMSSTVCCIPCYYIPIRQYVKSKHNFNGCNAHVSVAKCAWMNINIMSLGRKHLYKFVLQPVSKCHTCYTKLSMLNRIETTLLPQVQIDKHLLTRRVYVHVVWLFVLALWSCPFVKTT